MDAVKPSETRRSELDSKAILIIVGCCMLWGFQQISIKSVGHQLPYLLQAALRSLIATTCIGLWMHHKKIQMWKFDQTLLPGIAAGVLFTFEFYFLYQGLSVMPSSRAIIFLYLAPFVVAAILPFYFPSERLSWSQTLGLVIAFLAVFYLFRQDFEQANHSLSGDIMVVLSALSWGLTTVLVRVSKLSTIEPERTIFYQLFVSAILLSVIAFSEGVQIPRVWAPEMLASLFFQGVIVAGFSYLIWFWLLKHYPVTKISTFSFLTPIFGVGFSVVFLHDPLTLKLLLSATGVVLGIILVNRTRTP